jgi:nitrogen-specific signal transduction histidine kinase
MENAHQPDKLLDDEALVHELKCCVTVIHGYTQLLMRTHQTLGLDHPCLHRYTAIILDQTERLNAVLHGFRRRT